MSGQPERKRFWQRRWVRISGSLVLLVLSSLAIWIGMAIPWGPPEDPPPPVPNGYERLIELVHRLDEAGFLIFYDRYVRLELRLDPDSAVEFCESRDPEVEEFFADLSQTIQKEEALLVELETALSLDSRIVIDLAEGDHLWVKRDLNLIRLISETLRIQGLHETRQRGQIAGFSSELQVLQLVRSTGKGGMFIHRLLSQTEHQTVCERLRSLVPQLDLQQLDRLIRVHGEVLRVVNDSQDLARAIQRERYYGWKHGALVDNVRATLESLVPESAEETLEKHLFTWRAIANLIQVEFALQRYRLEQGRHPDRLDDLVPAILSEIPRDPFGDGPLRSRKSGSELIVYSVGPDGTDDSGKLFQPGPKESIYPGFLNLVRLPHPDGPDPGPHDLRLVPVSERDQVQTGS